jgi:hypothetical protein
MMSPIKSRNIFGFHAWNKKGAGKHKDKKWHNKNRKRGKVDENE